MDALKSMEVSGVVPVVVLDKAEDAVPTARALIAGGVNTENIAEFVASPSVHAVGGSWVCAKADIAAHNFEKITALCAEARKGAGL